MKLRVNGEDKDYAGPPNLEGLIRELGVDRHVVVAEVNRRIVPRAEDAATVLSEGDVVELIQFVGGG